MNINSLFHESSKRNFTTNLILCICALIGMLLVPNIVGLLLLKVIKNELVCSIIGTIVFIIILVLMYYKDLVKEFKRYKNNFKENFRLGFKFYILGFMGMVFFNVLIAFFLTNIANNEMQVREMLYSNVVYTMINISILAPICEELVFRKSLEPVIKNKWIYVVVCGLLFGGAHILTNVVNEVFVLTDLFYILPYACLGSAFALMDYETKTTFTSIVMHSLHNTATGLLLLTVYFSGVI